MAGLSVPSWQLKAAGLPEQAARPRQRTATPYNTPNPAGFTRTSPTNPQQTGGTYAQTPGTAPIPGVSPTGKTWGVDPTGTATPYTPQSNPQGGTNWTPGEGVDLFDLQMQRMAALLKMFGQQGGPQNPLPREMPGPAPGREVPTTMADRTAAESAAFGRAKDRIGKLGGGAMMALKDRSTAGGRAGSGLEAKDAREIVQGTRTQLGEVVRDQAIDAMDRADQIDDRNLATGVAQRGQDIGIRSGDQASQVQQRGQDYNAILNPYQNPMLSSMVPTMFGGFGGGMPRIY